MGYAITGKWLHQEQQFTSPDNKTLLRPSLPDECQELSERDIADIFAADTLILFEPGIALERNTRVAEFGMALGWGKQCIVIGPEDEDKKDVISNIFVHLRNVSSFQAELKHIKPVVQYPHWHAFLTDIVSPAPVECCNGCAQELPPFQTGDNGEKEFRIRSCNCLSGLGSHYKWKTKTGLEVLPNTNRSGRLKQIWKLQNRSGSGQE